MRRLILCLACFLVAPAEPIQASPPAAMAPAIDYGTQDLVGFPQSDGSVWYYWCVLAGPPPVWVPLYGPWIVPAPATPDSPQ